MSSHEISLRRFIEFLKEKGELLCWRTRVNIKYGISKVLKKYDEGPAIFFPCVEGYSIDIVGNVISKRSRLLQASSVIKDVDLYEMLLKACNEPLRAKVHSDGPFMEFKVEDLRKLPILVHYERDGGPYITSGIVVARDPESDFQNASFHRMMLLDERHLVIRIVPRHLYKICEKYKNMGKDTPIAIMIGTHPLVMLSAASSPPYGVNELYVANRLVNDKLELTVLPESNLEVTRFSEIVIEGRILNDLLHDEGPFVDITGTYDVVRKQPVVEVDKIFLRENAIYQALLPASSEHRILMGFFKEALIWSYTSRVADIKAVRLTKGGCGWLHCIISIKKVTEGDAKNVILAAFAAHPSLKMVVVVDDDINVDNPYDVEWAIATRFQADEDLVIVSKVRGSSLDPSADQKTLLTSKLGVDATRSLLKPHEGFERARIP